MDPIVLSGLITAGMRVWADLMERNAKGEITDADIDLMLTFLGSKADTWQAQIDAHRAKA